jgi:hypothetical protein
MIEGGFVLCCRTLCWLAGNAPVKVTGGALTFRVLVPGSLGL